MEKYWLDPAMFDLVTAFACLQADETPYSYLDFIRCFMRATGCNAVQAALVYEVTKRA